MKKSRKYRPVLLKNRWWKICIMMKLTLFMSVFFVFTSYATTFSQQKVNMKLGETTIKEALIEFQRLTHTVVLYSDDDFETNRKVVANFKNVGIEQFLTALLKESGMTYKLMEDYILILPVKVSVADSVKKVKGYMIRGTVKDTKGQLLPGVTVIVKGMSIGTATDQQGKYRLDIPEIKNLSLLFSFIGMETQEVKYQGKDTINVVMKDDVETLDDVIVTGYATIDRGSYVGAVTQIKADDIQVAGEATIDQMLQGWIPGMSVINKTGKVGGTPKIRIRGTSTLLGNQEPLWVVDGVIQSDPLPIPDDASPISSEMDGLRETAGNAISWLNPNDIETITVLKDASATAIYGSQAANGVIVITTKKAKKEGLSISYNGSFSVGQKPGYHLYDMMNSQERMKFDQEMWEDRNSYKFEVFPVGYAGLIQKLQGKEITREQFEQEFRKMENMNTDWFDILFRNSFSHSHNVSVSSRGDRIASRFSLGMNNTPGEASGNNMQSFTASSSTTFRLDERLIIDLQLNGSYRTTENFAFGVSPYGYAMNTSRVIPLRDDDGDLYYHEKSGLMSYSIPNKNSYNYNILNEMNNTGTETDAINFQVTLNTRIKIWDGLEWQIGGSYSLSSNKVKSWATEYSHYITQLRGYEAGTVLPNSGEQNASILPFGGLLQEEHGQNNNYSFRTSLVYSKTFNDDHHFTANLGFQANSSNMEGSATMRYGYLFYRGEKFATVPLEVTTMPGMTSSNSTNLHEKMRQGTNITTTTNNTLSEYLTLVYNYKQRYVLNFNARLDASNRFGQDENKRFNPSWSLGAKWRIGNEPWMAWASSWYDMFDLSFSYGWRGNAVQTVSPYMITQDGGLDTYSKQYILKLKSLPYPDLGWEKTEDWNLGIDFSFFSGRLSAGLGFYEKVSHVLSSREVVIENGVTNAYIDGTVMKNKGYEIYISSTPIRTKNFSWSISFNTGKAKNSISNNKRINTRDDYLEGNAIIDGEAYQTFYAYAFNGLDPTNGRPTFKNMDIEETDNYLDYLVKVGCMEPDISGGINTSIRYKKFALRANMAMSFGAKTFLPKFFATSGAPAPEQNAPRYMFKRWRKPGDEKVTNIPSIPTGNPNNMSVVLPTGERNVSPYDMYNLANVQVASTDFIRCRSISLQYYLPADYLKKIGIRQASVSASLSNPFFIAFDKAWEGKDPETADWPARRTVSCSLSLSF